MRAQEFTQGPGCVVYGDHRIADANKITEATEFLTLQAVNPAGASERGYSILSRANGSSIQIPNSDIFAILVYPQAMGPDMTKEEANYRLGLAESILAKFPRLLPVKKAVQLWQLASASAVAQEPVSMRATPRITVSGQPQVKLNYQQDRKNFNAIWVKGDGAVEWVKIERETTEAYLLPITLMDGRIGQVGVPKREILYVSLSSKSFSDLIGELASRGKLDVLAPVSDHAAAVPLDQLSGVPHFIELLDRPEIFNRLDSALREKIISVALRQNMDGPGVFARASAALRQVSPKSYAPIEIPLTQLYIMKAGPELQTLFGELASRSIPAPPPINAKLLQIYRAFETAQLLIQDFHGAQRDIFVPTLDTQKPLSSSEGDFHTVAEATSDPKDFQLVKASEGEFFISSPAMSPDSTFNTRTIRLIAPPKDMSDFLSSDDAAKGQFALLACRVGETETRGNVQFVPAKPVILVRRTPSGEYKFIYANENVATSITDCTICTLGDSPNSLIASDNSNRYEHPEGYGHAGGQTGMLTQTNPRRSDSPDSPLFIGGRWSIVQGNRTDSFDLDDTGYSPDRRYRLRENAGMLLLRGPDDTWTLHRDSDGKIRGTSDTLGSTVVLAHGDASETEGKRP